jgi:hypothetical protein
MFLQSVNEWNWKLLVHILDKIVEISDQSRISSSPFSSTSCCRMKPHGFLILVHYEPRVAVALGVNVEDNNGYIVFELNR